ncbi:MAG: DNA mismatch endonuclease Vsr [Blastocatellia bacterium]|nr:DNA mismatch endonuclease Vsr [Blastocatellia bacterium]
MTDIFTRAKRSAVMAKIKSRGNKATEVRLARILREYGVKGWRRNYPLQGRPDFAFASARVAIFVDGCFWHSCPKHGHRPASNQNYWTPKLARNQRRDRRVSRQLRASGWRVLRVWEHQLAAPATVAMRIQRCLEQPRLRGSSPR